MTTVFLGWFLSLSISGKPAICFWNVDAWIETLSEFFQQAYDMSASISTFGKRTFDPRTIWLIFLQSPCVKLLSYICFNISPNSRLSLNLWLLFKAIATLIEFSQRPEFAYDNWFYFSLTGGSWQKSPQKIIKYPPKIMLGDKTSLPWDLFLQTRFRQAFNFSIWSSVENKISSIISMLTWSQILIISSEICFDFEFKNDALCNVTPPNSATAQRVIAVKRKVFSP